MPRPNEPPASRPGCTTPAPPASGCRRPPPARRGTTPPLPPTTAPPQPAQHTLYTRAKPLGPASSPTPPPPPLGKSSRHHHREQGWLGTRAQRRPTTTTTGRLPWPCGRPSRGVGSVAARGAARRRVRRTPTPSRPSLSSPPCPSLAGWPRSRPPATRAFKPHTHARARTRAPATSGGVRGRLSGRPTRPAAARGKQPKATRSSRSRGRGRRGRPARWCPPVNAAPAAGRRRALHGPSGPSR